MKCPWSWCGRIGIVLTSRFSSVAMLAVVDGGGEMRKGMEGGYRLLGFKVGCVPRWPIHLIISDCYMSLDHFFEPDPNLSLKTFQNRGQWSFNTSYMACALE